MQLGNFVEREMVSGDQWPAKEAVGHPLVVLVREHRHGIKTKHNNNPALPGYKEDGGDGVIVDVADLTTNQVYIDVLWMSGAITDALSPYVGGDPVAVRFDWTPSKSGGNPYIGVKALEAAELNQAASWVAANPTRFETERAQRQAAAAAQAAAVPPVNATTPPPDWAVAAPPATPPAPAAPAAPPATPPAPATPPPALDPTSPEIAALLATLNQGGTAPH
jgi:hypothetical protein